ncbi:MAG TPA: hypothetical protein VL022_04730 [Moheibacter sp.]|nr:hypothetical protein [Moheibacter sp.]
MKFEKPHHQTRNKAKLVVTPYGKIRMYSQKIGKKTIWHTEEVAPCISGVKKVNRKIVRR